MNLFIEIYLKLTNSLYNNSANTKFIGKSIHYLPSCHSTNEVAAELIRTHKATNGLIVITDNQTAGKGQQGNTWYSAAQQNLTFTVILLPKELLFEDSFYLNIISSLAVAETLEKFVGFEKTVTVKWPNDVYIENKKASGILIETILRGNKINSIVLGIGLNINQENFALATATSLCIATGKKQDLQEVLNIVSERLEFYVAKFETSSKGELFDAYKNKLMGLNRKNTFRDREGVFTGYIRDVAKNGTLLLEKETGELKSYQFKEVQLELDHP